MRSVNLTDTLNQTKPIENTTMTNAIIEFIMLAGLLTMWVLLYVLIVPTY